MAARSIFAARFAVRIKYPGRKGRGKRDLLKVMPTWASAVLYAKRVAARGGKGDVTHGILDFQKYPVACVYDLSKWGEAPECYARRPPEHAKSPGSYVLKGPRSVRRVPATFARYR